MLLCSFGIIHDFETAKTTLWGAHVFFSLCHVIAMVLLCFCNLCNHVILWPWSSKDSGKLVKVDNQDQISWGAISILWLCFHVHLDMFVTMWPLRWHYKEPKRVTILLSGTNIICCYILLSILKCHDDLKHFHQPFHLIVWVAHFLSIEIFKQWVQTE